MQVEDISRKLAPGETPPSDIGSFLREAAEEVEFTEGGLQGASFILCTQKLGPQHTACIELFNQSVLTIGPHLFRGEHLRINECMAKQSGKKFERALKACKKPYEKLWSAYGNWFQAYFGSMTGETCKEEFNSLNECISSHTDAKNPEQSAAVIEKCQSYETKLMKCRADTMFAENFKLAEQCAGKKTPECDQTLRLAARSLKLANIYHNSFWAFVTQHAEDFLNTELSPDEEDKE